MIWLINGIIWIGKNLMEYLIKIKEKKLKNICMRVNLNLKKSWKKIFFVLMLYMIRIEMW